MVLKQALQFFSCVCAINEGFKKDEKTEDRYTELKNFLDSYILFDGELPSIE